MKLTRYVCLFAACFGLARAQATDNLPLASFDQVWNTVRTRHWDRDKTGAAWDRARQELRPEAERAHSASEVRPVIQKLLGTLGESHFGVIPAEAYEQLHDGMQEGLAQPPFDFRMIENDALVTRAAGGIELGWALVRIGSQDVAPMLEKVHAASTSEREFQLMAYAFLLRRMSGQAGDRKSITFGLPGGETKTANVALIEPGRIAHFGHLPPLPMWIESKLLDDATGYFRFNVFFDPEWLQVELGAAVRACAACRGFILDLRGNLGGIVALAPAVAAWFVSKPEPLGVMTSNAGSMKLTINPRPGQFQGKLAVLIDSLSVSSAEFLAAGLKDLGRARLFGEVTQGAALPSVVERLPDGDRFQFAIADYVSAAGASIEGAGVTPHVAVRLTRNALLSGRDPALEAARLWLNSQE